MSEIKPCPTFTPEATEAANIETERLCRELNITNADHIALWIERNTIPDEPMSQCASWLACRIVEAHEAHCAELTASLNRASDACATVQRERDALREMLGEAVDAIKELLPSNVGWLPAHMPDSSTLPLDVTFGEIRKARAFLSRYEGEVK